MKKSLLLSLFIMLFTAMAIPANASTTGDLVNTESFFIIDDGDGTTDIELQFGDILGEILKYDITNARFEFTDDLYVQGDVSMEGGLLLDADDTGGDITIQFGTVLAEVISWDSVNSRFNISDDLFVNGTLEVNGNIDFNQNLAQEMVIDQGSAFPGSAIEGQIFYRTDLDTLHIFDGINWIAFSDASGMNSIFLAPLYPHTTYYPDGSNNTGQLTYYFDATNIENAYRWNTTRPNDQDYDIKVRVQLPDNFANWETNPIEFKYKTDTTTIAANQLSFTMQDTADAAVTMSNNTGLVSSVADTWVESTNMTITGGTWNPGGWFTITIKLTADNGGGAEAGSIVLNYDVNN